MRVPGQRCLACRHFRNGPRYLESVFKGMNILGSAYGSVRSNDGICELRGMYLSADGWCDAFEAAAPAPPGSDCA